MEQVLQAACLSCGSVNSVKAARITRSTEFIRGMSPVSLLTSEGIDVASFTPALSLCLEMLLYLTYGHAVSIAVLLVVLH